MRVVLPLIALVLTTGAGAPQVVEGPPLATALDPGRAICRDRIQQVRRELGQPALERDASPQEPLFIAAVDKRIGGCAVMVMRNDTSDVRPLPEPREHRLMPAK